MDDIYKHRRTARSPGCGAQASWSMCGMSPHMMACQVDDNICSNIVSCATCCLDVQRRAHVNNNCALDLLELNPRPSTPLDDYLNA